MHKRKKKTIYRNRTCNHSFIAHTQVHTGHIAIGALETRREGKKTIEFPWLCRQSSKSRIALRIRACACATKLVHLSRLECSSRLYTFTNHHIQHVVHSDRHHFLTLGRKNVRAREQIIFRTNSITLSAVPRFIHIQLVVALVLCQRLASQPTILSIVAPNAKIE